MRLNPVRVGDGGDSSSGSRAWREAGNAGSAGTVRVADWTYRRDSYGVKCYCDSDGVEQDIYDAVCVHMEGYVIEVRGGGVKEQGVSSGDIRGLSRGDLVAFASWAHGEYVWVRNLYALL